MLSQFLVVLLAIGSANSLSCPCWNETPRCSEPPPKDCKGGLTGDSCGCCQVCAKVEGEICGGPWQISGRCDEGLYCASRNSSRPFDGLRDGICKRKSNASCLYTDYVPANWCYSDLTNCSKTHDRSNCPLTCKVKPKCPGCFDVYSESYCDDWKHDPTNGCGSRRFQEVCERTCGICGPGPKQTPFPTENPVCKDEITVCGLIISEYDGDFCKLPIAEEYCKAACNYCEDAGIPVVYNEGQRDSQDAGSPGKSSTQRASLDAGSPVKSSKQRDSQDAGSRGKSSAQRASLDVLAWILIGTSTCKTLWLTEGF